MIEEEKFIKTITNALPGLVGYWTKTLHCSFANQAYLDWFGKSAEEMIGIHLSELYNGELFRKNAPYLTGVLEGKAQQFENSLVKANGDFVHMYVQFIPHEVNSTIVGFFVSALDITKIKEAEALIQARTLELERVHSKYVSLLDNMREGIQLLDFNYTYIYLNNATEKHGKTKKEELIGHTIMEKYPGIEHTHLFAQIRSCMNERIPQTFENEFVYPDGTKQWFEIRISPIPEGILILSLDIGERKKIANELLLANKAREEEILFSASRMAALGEMASGIAHEINNPLSIIIMKAAQLIRKNQLNSLTEEELEEGLAKIASTSQRIGMVVKGLSSISRPPENDPIQKIKLISVIEDTLQLCREHFSSNSIKLQSDLFSINDIEIEGKSSQIMQVILNLLNNSFDAIYDHEEAWVSIRAIQTDSGVLVTVTDSGFGIPDQLLSKIMQPFFTTKGPGKGTGLGLSISKGIIEEHQGKFYYQKNSINTCFAIELPFFQKKRV